MELGEKLRLARQEAGLSQRQLCGDAITRNMLSQIEHGTARPSMDTLRYLAARLQKPVSFFLEEDVVVSPNLDLMTRARAAWQAGNTETVLELLNAFQQPDPVLDWEFRYLTAIAAMETARQVMADKPRYARQLLEDMACPLPEQQRQRLLLLGRLPDGNLPELVRQLPSLDGELLLRAEAALGQRNFARAYSLLSAAEDQAAPRWQLLQGRVLLGLRQYAQAAPHLEAAELQFPRVCHPLLEECFLELGDFQKAYLYACKQRSRP